MAKKKNTTANENENNEQDNSESKGSKVVTVLIVLVIVAIWLGIFGLLIKMDVGGLGSQVLYPVLKDVPLVNKILPVSASDADNTYNYSSVADAVERIKELEKQLDATNGSSSANTSYIDELKAEVSRLKKYEEQQTAFEKEKYDFDQKVVFNDKAPELSEYKAFYEKISPDNAESIYKQVIKQLQYDEKVKKQAEIFAKMQPDKAATVLEVMTNDLDLIAGILDSMSQSKSALILDNMSDEFAAQVTKKMTLADK